MIIHQLLLVFLVSSGLALPFDVDEALIADVLTEAETEVDQLPTKELADKMRSNPGHARYTITPE